MDFDEQLRRYFGTSDLAAVPPAAREAARNLMDLLGAAEGGD